MGSRFNLKRCIALLAVFQSLFEISLAKNLGTVTPCPHCGPSIAPKPITITAQYETVSTCEPSKTTIFHTHTKRHKTSTTSKVKTVPSCSSYAWVSTKIPVYKNHKKTSSLVTTTNQPVTFSSLHYTETHTTTLTLPWHHGKGNGTHHNGTHHSKTTTTKKSYTTIDVKDYCDYNSIGPIAIHGYKGSGLCKDCGPDERGALTQRLTVVSCSNKHCTTFNETWIALPTTYSSSGTTSTTMTTNTYCPTATPVTAMPGYTSSAPTGASTPGPTTSSHPVQTTSSTTTSATPTGYPTHPTTTTTICTTDTETDTETESEPTPTETYGSGGEANPSDYMDNDPPAPSPYHPASSYKLFKRQGLEQPRGRVMKRSGLLFWGQ